MNNIYGCPNCGDKEVIFRVDIFNKLDNEKWYLQITEDDYYSTEITYCPFCSYKLPDIDTTKELAHE